MKSFAVFRLFILSSKHTEAVFAFPQSCDGVDLVDWPPPQNLELFSRIEKLCIQVGQAFYSQLMQIVSSIFHSSSGIQLTPRFY